MKNYKIYYLVISIFLLTSIISGCSSDNSLYYYNIHGTVTTESLNKPIKGAIVSIGNKSDSTDSEGNYIINNIKKGTYTWTVESQKYIDYSQEIYIDNNLNINKQLSLDTVNATITGTVQVYNSSEEYTLQSMSTSSDNIIKTNNLTSKSTTPQFKKQQIIINFMDNIALGDIDKFIKNNHLIKISRLNLEDNNIYLFKLPDNKSVIETVDTYNQSKLISWAEPNYIMELSAKPNDSLYDQQWGNRNVNLEPAWDIIDNKKRIKIAVIDSGIISNHEDLTANINLNDGKDFIDNDFDPIDESSNYSHGTHVSGIIGAVSNNNTGIAGVNSNVEIIPIRIFDANGYTQSTSDIAEAINYAVQKNVDIINMSFGGSNSLTMYEPIKTAHEKGIVLVAAAGNNGPDIYYPAKFPETIAVGATDIDNNITYYSNTGSELDLVAPGGGGNGILSTSGYYKNEIEYTDKYVLMEGTSMATPYVSGIASLLLSQGVRPSDLKNRLTSTAVDLLPPGKDRTYGYGLVDAYGALINKRLKKPYIFAATKENGSINIKSEFKTINNDNTYKLNEIMEDKVIVIGWRDVNEDQIINKGDYYGESKTEIDLLENSLYNNIDIDMYYIPQDNNTNMQVMNMTEIKSE